MLDNESYINLEMVLLYKKPFWTFLKGTFQARWLKTLLTACLVNTSFLRWDLWKGSGYNWPARKPKGCIQHLLDHLLIITRKKFKAFSCITSQNLLHHKEDDSRKHWTSTSPLSCSRTVFRTTFKAIFRKAFPPFHGNCTVPMLAAWWRTHFTAMMSL